MMKTINIKKVAEDLINDRDVVREKRKKRFEELMKREPELQSGERYRGGKRASFGDLIFALMDMHRDGERFLHFCEKVLTENFEELEYEIFSVDKELEKISNPELAKEIRNSIYNILDWSGNFYIPLGAFLGQNYIFADRDAQKEIDDIGKLMCEEKVFPLIAKPVQPTSQAGTPGNVIPLRPQGPGKGAPKAEKPRLEGKQYISAVEVARKLGRSRSWVYKKRKAGILPHYELGGTTRFVEKDIDTWAEAHKIKGCQKI